MVFQSPTRAVDVGNSCLLSFPEEVKLSAHPTEFREVLGAGAGNELVSLKRIWPSLWDHPADSPVARSFTLCGRCEPERKLSQLPVRQKDAPNSGRDWYLSSPWQLPGGDHFRKVVELTETPGSSSAAPWQSVHRSRATQYCGKTRGGVLVLQFHSLFLAT